jgi:hypothetical protein
MAHTFEARKTIRGSYLLSEDIVRRMVKHMSASGGILTASLKFKNERTIVSDDIDEILNDSLIRSTEIDELQLRVITPSHAIAEVLFKNGSGAMGYGIRGDRQWVLALEHEILSEIDAGKLWFQTSILVDGLSLQIQTPLSCVV